MAETSQDNYPSVEQEFVGGSRSRKRLSLSTKPKTSNDKIGARLLCDTWRIPNKRRVQIGFVGLAVPHFAKALVGADYRWILPYSCALGILLLVGADIVGRLVVRPGELPVGIVTALIGAPFLVYLARTIRVSN